MIFKCISEISEKELDINKYNKITPIYKKLNDDLTDEIHWIHDNIIVDVSCEHIWNLYYEAFIEKKILSKHDFYKLIRRELSLKCKVIRIDKNTMYCFVKC
jgi:hypothetical protein